MDKDMIRYTLAKQVISMQYISTSYGDIDLDTELAEAVQEALERILYPRIGEQPPVDTIPVEIAECQRDELNKISDQTGHDVDYIALRMFDWGYEAMSEMAGMIKRKDQ